MKCRYLIIEDAAFIRELIKGACSSVGAICVGESDGGRHAIELFMDTLPDVVFLDLVLPGQNGVQLAGEFRKIWPEARIIACSSIDDERIIKKARENGIDAYISKPFTKEQILETLKGQIQRKNEVAQ